MQPKAGVIPIFCGVLAFVFVSYVEGKFYDSLLSRSKKPAGGKRKLTDVFHKAELHELTGKHNHDADEFHIRDGGHVIVLGHGTAKLTNKQNFEWQLIKTMRNLLTTEAVDWLEARISEKSVSSASARAAAKAAKEKAATRMAHMVDVIKELHPHIPVGTGGTAIDPLPRDTKALLNLLLVDFKKLEQLMPAEVRATPRESTPGVDWSYDENDIAGPSRWKNFYPSCGGRRQSPIDIRTGSSRVTDFDDMRFKNLAIFRENITIQHTGKTAKITLNSNNNPISVTGGGLPGKYKMEQIHFHWGDPITPGSEHLKNGVRQPAEMHMVFLKEGYESEADAAKDPNGAAVMGFFLNVEPNDNPELQTVFSRLGVIQMPMSEAFVTQPVSFERLLTPSFQGTYYRYNGSLTTPNCAEAVIWTIFDIPIGISQRQLDAFPILRDEKAPQEPLTDNFRRPLQSMNGRVLLRRRI